MTTTTYTSQCNILGVTLFIRISAYNASVSTEHKLSKYLWKIILANLYAAKIVQLFSLSLSLSPRLIIVGRTVLSPPFNFLGYLFTSSTLSHTAVDWRKIFSRHASLSQVGRESIFERNSLSLFLQFCLPLFFFFRRWQLHFKEFRSFVFVECFV